MGSHNLVVRIRGRKQGRLDTRPSTFGRDLVVRRRVEDEWFQ